MDDARHRTEQDLIGPMQLPQELLYGIHTARAMENFFLAGRPVHPALVAAYGDVKLTCALTNRALGVWAEDPTKANAIERACRDQGISLLPPKDPCEANPLACQK